jgi:hypothetical protein
LIRGGLPQRPRQYKGGLMFSHMGGGNTAVEFLAFEMRRRLDL